MILLQFQIRCQLVLNFGVCERRRTDVEGIVDVFLYYIHATTFETMTFSRIFCSAWWRST